MATINPDKLSFNFAQAAEFRFAGKKIDLAKATDEITVKDKHGNDKIIRGFQAADGTFFRLKKTADGGHQINVYGTPDQLAKSNLQVRGGEVTRARFGDERYRKTDPDLFGRRDFELDGSILADRDAFAKLHGLQHRTVASLDAGAAPQPHVPLSGTSPPVQGLGPTDRETGAEPPGDPVFEAQQPAAAPPSHAASPQLLLDSTPIDASNREALKDHVGYGQFFRNADPAFSDRLSSYLAVLTGREQPPPGTSPLDLLDDGRLTFGDVQAAIDQLSISMGSAPQQDPIAMLAALGREPIPTLADGNCLYAALAHSLCGADAMDRDAALEQRRELKDVFQIARQNPEQLALIAGRVDAENVARVDAVLGAGLSGERVDADGWGGEESLKLAAMKHQRTLVAISGDDMRIFDPRGGMRSFPASALPAFQTEYGQLDQPVVLMLKGFHWQATAER